jgi:hypothetical protein
MRQTNLGRNWNPVPNEDGLYAAFPDKINGAIVKLENYNGTMMVLSFHSGTIIKIVQNVLYCNRTDIMDCQ